jgi:ribose/xylose/arabinose/galactoside ABC-type transport system permease subunit
MAHALSGWFGSSGIPNYVQEILVGVVIVIAALADRRRHR